MMSLVNVSDWNSFRTNRFIPKSIPELILVDPKKVLNLIWCKSVENLSELIRDFESEWIRTNFSILMYPRSETFELRTQFESFWPGIQNFVRIHLDWIGLNFGSD